MSNQIFRAFKPEEYKKAGSTDLIELLPVKNQTPLFIHKWILETMVYGIVNHEFIHLSGPTGSAKSSLIEALHLCPGNFMPICESLGFKRKPIRLFPVEMAIFETPGELYQRRSLNDGTTYDEKSDLIKGLILAEKSDKNYYPLIWLREMGRVHSSSVQGGLLNLMTKGDICLPDGQRIQGAGISWVADSNYQAEFNSTHTLVTLDDALKRRFTINLTLDYLPAEQESQVLKHLTANDSFIPQETLINQTVSLGNLIRHHKMEGNLLTVPPPTIFGYINFLRQSVILPHLSYQQIAMSTLLGNACQEDQKQIPGIINEVFGLNMEIEENEDITIDNLF